MVILNRCGSIKTEKIVLTLNWRIIPISILAYRYLMVCHVNLCYRSVSQSSCFLLERLTWWYPELERRLSEIFLSGEADDVKRISISEYFILFTDWRFWSHLYLLVRQYITETRSGKFLIKIYRYSLFIILSRDFNICNGREETILYHLSDFWRYKGRRSQSVYGQYFSSFQSTSASWSSSTPGIPFNSQE